MLVFTTTSSFPTKVRHESWFSAWIRFLYIPYLLSSFTKLSRLFRPEGGTCSMRTKCYPHKRLKWPASDLSSSPKFEHNIVSNQNYAILRKYLSLLVVSLLAFIREMNIKFSVFLLFSSDVSQFIGPHPWFRPLLNDIQLFLPVCLWIFLFEVFGPFP